MVDEVEVEVEVEEANKLDNSDIQGEDSLIDIPDSDSGYRIEDVIAGGQAEIAALKKENQDLRRKLTASERSELKSKDEAKRESQKAKKILEEKRLVVEKLKNVQSMFEGIDMETAQEVLRRAKEGEVSNFESESAVLVEVALSDFRETHHNPLVEELEEEKKTNEVLRTKLHNAVVKSTIVNKAISKGVDADLAELVVPFFEKKMKINDKGDMKYISHEGFEVDKFDWDASFMLLRDKKPRLFLPSQGSRATSSTDPKTSNKDFNPWMKGSIDRTAQIQMLTEDKDRASRLKEEARKANRKKV